MNNPGDKSDETPATSETGLIWKIDRFALHDGPGIRTSVYFQGCPLRCAWCSNPEGQARKGRLLYIASRCDGCGRCYRVCSHGAIAVIGEDGGARIVLDHGLCEGCGDCVEVCSTGALSVPARRRTSEELLELFERDRGVYRRSGGGVTCTGGEPLMQAPFLAALLQECRRRGLHTALETSGCATPEALESVLPHVDLLFFDLKHPRPLEHRRLTSRDNDMILRNLRQASEFMGIRGRRLILRYVVVPGLNDGEAIEAMAQIAASLPHLDYVELLALHEYGSYKYAALGLQYGLEDHPRPSADEMEDRRLIVEKQGCACIVGNV